MNFNEFFPHRVCINLDTRQDRWERMTARFAEHGIERVIRFPAVDGKKLEIPSLWPTSPGAYGCLRSHLAVVEQARDQARPSVMIFEDDTVLAPDFNSRFAEYVRQLPDDWDMVFLGALHGQPLTKVDDNLLRVSHSLSTYAYGLRHTIYDSFIELNRKAEAVLDENTRALQKRFNCYCFTPHLAWVEEDYSDVRGGRVDLWWLRESLALYSPEIDEMLRRTVAIISHSNDKPGSLRNLSFLTRYLSEELPGITIRVLERADRRVNLSRFFKQSLEKFESCKEVFIFLDSDVFLWSEDVRGNLLKCRDYDFATLFREIYDLNEEDTLRIIRRDIGWDYDSHYQARSKETIYDSGFIVTRKGLRALSEQSDYGEELRVYYSSNRARRLFSG